MLVKFTNVCYYRGGSKVPFRIRKYQNYTTRINDSYKTKLDSEIIALIPYLTKYRYFPMSTTKVVKLASV